MIDRKPPDSSGSGGGSYEGNLISYRITQMEVRLDKEIARLEQEHDREIRELRIQFERDTKEAYDQFQKELKELKEHIEKRIGRIETFILSGLCLAALSIVGALLALIGLPKP